MNTPKDIFRRVIKLSGIGDSPKNYHNYSIYRVSSYTDSRVVFRVDCGDVGSFEIAKHSEEEVYVTKKDKWVWVPADHYVFTCLSETHSGYPLMNCVDALAVLNGTYQKQH